MGIVIRQSVPTAAISYAGVVIGYINLLYLYPRFLDPEQIGLMRTIQDAAILFTPFAQFGLAQSILRYYPRMAGTKQQSGGFITLMLLFAVGGFTIFFTIFKIFERSILSYFSENADAIITYSSLVLWLTFILLIMAVLEAYSRSLLKTVVPNLLREVVARLLLSVLVSMYFLHMISFHQFLIGTALAYAICLAVLIGYLAHLGELRLTMKWREVKAASPSGLLRYSVLSFAGTAGLIIIGKVDSIMVSGMLGLASNAIYTTAFYMATVIEVPRRAISQIAMPLISKSFETKNIDQINDLYQKASLLQFIIGAILLTGVWANLSNLFLIMPNGSIYRDGEWVVLIIGLGKLIDMLFGPSSEIIVLSKYYTFNIILILLLSLLVVISNNVLIPQFGIMGAAIGSSLALILFNFVKYIFVYVKLHIQPFSSGSLKVVTIIGIVVLLNLILPTFSNVYLDLITRSTIISFVYLVSIIGWKVSPDTNDLFYRMLKWNKGGRR